MIRLSVVSALAVALVRAQGQSEPAPRTLAALPLQLTVDLAQVAGVRELANGHLLISDAAAPAILVVDPSNNGVRKLGREGRGPNEFVRPGGLYDNSTKTKTGVITANVSRFMITHPSIPSLPGRGG